MVNDCASNEIFYFFRYNDSGTVGVDKGCSTSIDVYRSQVPSLIAEYLHVSCSDTFDSTGLPTKSDLGDPDRRVAAYYIQKPDGRSCGFGNPAGQTIQGEIYLCVDGAPSTTLADGGTIAVPSAGLSSANPLAPTQVDAGDYAMDATAPSGLGFVSCGQSGVTINSPDSATQTVTVPQGGAGDGIFYVQASPRYGYLEICKSDANGVSGNFEFTVAGQSVTVPAGACSAAIRLAAGDVDVRESRSPGYRPVSASTRPASRLVGYDVAARTVRVTIAPGGVSNQTILTVVNKPTRGTVKVCEVAGQGVDVGTEFAFGNSANSSVVSVPAGPASSGGYCVVLPGRYRGGSTLTVTQVAQPGTRVAAIKVAPGNRGVSKDRSARTVQLVVGSRVTEVTFTNEASS